MIREILEQQGMLNKEWLDIVYWGNDTDVEYIAIIDRKNNYNTCVGLIRQKDRDDYAIEQACRQYVKENGFKLEWLPEHLQEHYKNHKKYYEEFIAGPYPKSAILKDMLLSPQVPMVDKWFDLFCWLIANDINIID